MSNALDSNNILYEEKPLFVPTLAEVKAGELISWENQNKQDTIFFTDKKRCTQTIT